MLKIGKFQYDVASDIHKLVCKMNAAMLYELTTKIDHMQWYAEDGIDTVYLSDNSISRTRLNEVNWKSTGIAFRLTMILK